MQCGSFSMCQCHGRWPWTMIPEVYQWSTVLRFSEFRPEDWQAAAPRAALEMRAIVQVVVGRSLGHREGAGQRRRGLDRGDSRVEILFHIGPEMQAAARLQRPRDLRQEVLVHDPAFLMPSFPPRVGEIDMHCP